MRALRFLNVAVLGFLLLGTAALYAQDDKPRQDEARPEEKPSESRPAAKQDEMKAPKQDEAKPPKQDEAKPSKQERNEEKQTEKQNEKQNENQPRQEMRGGQTQAHPAGRGGHIPDDKFRAQFGRGHKFAVQRTTIEGGQPGFVYGGYTFGFIDAWPADWAYTDDCYVDYVDGEYFLFDLMHPGLRIALFVVM